MFVRTWKQENHFTKYAKSLNELELKGNLSAEALKNVKAVYINHFYNYENVKGIKRTRLKKEKIPKLGFF